MLLEAQANSNQMTPDYIEVSASELDKLIEECKPAFDLPISQISSVNLSHLAEFEFKDEDEVSCTEDEDFSKWEQVSTVIGKSTAMLVFAHTQDGTELFCLYDQDRKSH